MTANRFAISNAYSYTFCSASSREAAILEQALHDARLSEAQSAVLGGVRLSALSELDSFYVGASKKNWDGEDSIPVCEDAYENARRFLALMPQNWFKPEINADPDGEVAVEWHAGPRRRFSISIGNDAHVSYAWLNGSERGHGTDTFDDEIPSGIIAQVSRLVDR